MPYSLEGSTLTGLQYSKGLPRAGDQSALFCSRNRGKQVFQQRGTCLATSAAPYSLPGRCSHVRTMRSRGWVCFRLGGRSDRACSAAVCAMIALPGHVQRSSIECGCQRATAGGRAWSRVHCLAIQVRGDILHAGDPASGPARCIVRCHHASCCAAAPSPKGHTSSRCVLDAGFAIRAGQGSQGPGQ